MDPKIFVYALVDPETELIRYIGRTRVGMSRPQHHFSSALHEKSHKANWIKQLRSRGATYTVIILELCTEEELVAAECRWISHGVEHGWPLTNAISGGEGALVFSVEHRNAISRSKKGRRPVPKGPRRPAKKRSNNPWRRGRLGLLF